MFDHPFYINVRENRRADQEWTNDTGNIGHKTQNRRADQEWTIEWHRQHWEQDTEPKGRSRVNNWMTQATLGTRHKTEGPIKNEQLNDTGNIGNKTQNRRADQEWTIEWHRQHWAQDTEPKGRSRVNNWMTQATLGTRHRTEGPIKNEQLNDAVNIGNKTQNEDKQNKQTHHRKLKRRTPPRHFWQCWHSCYILFHTFHLQITFLT
jgi:hypothetical protein